MQVEFLQISSCFHDIYSAFIFASTAVFDMVYKRGRSVDLKRDSTPTGAGVTVALIDSGVNAQHSHVGSVADGVHFLLDEENTVQTRPEYPDQIGHGTALAGVVRAKAPQAVLYAVKIFTDHLATSFPVLEAALQWAIDQRIKIINLSLGLINAEHRQPLVRLVDQAHAAQLILVASSPPDRSDVLPATLPGVIGVAADDTCSWDEHHYVAHSPVPFRSHPHPRPLPGPAQTQNFHGHSFASAHIAATLALQAERHPDLNMETAQQYLQRTSTKQ